MPPAIGGAFFRAADRTSPYSGSDRFYNDIFTVVCNSGNDPVGTSSGFDLGIEGVAGDQVVCLESKNWGFGSVGCLGQYHMSLLFLFQ